jgi:hypothetical protein
MGPPLTAATQTMEAPAYAHPLAPAATSSVAPPAAPPNVAQSVPAPPRAVSPVLAGAAAPARGGAGRLARWGGAAALGVTILAALTAKYRGASTDGPTGAELKAGPRLPSRDDSIARLSAGDTVPAPERRALLRALNAAHALHGAVNLSGLDLGGARLVGIDLSSATLHETKLVNAQLDSANLTGADLTGADLTNARLLGANLSGARVAGASFDGANLFGATLDGVRLDSARTNAATVLRDSTPGPYRRDEDVAAAAPAAPASGARAEGYVWIGNYDRAQAQWEKVRIADSAGTPLTRDPALMRVGATYVLRGDLTLRRDWPQQGPEYFAAVVPLGWLPSGTTVTLRAEPRAYVRAGRTQYWARVEVDRVGVRR